MNAIASDRGSCSCIGYEVLQQDGEQNELHVHNAFRTENNEHAMLGVEMSEDG